MKLPIHAFHVTIKTCTSKEQDIIDAMPGIHGRVGIFEQHSLFLPSFLFWGKHINRLCTIVENRMLSKTIITTAKWSSKLQKFIIKDPVRDAIMSAIMQQYALKDVEGVGSGAWLQLTELSKFFKLAIRVWSRYCSTTESMSVSELVDSDKFSSRQVVDKSCSSVRSNPTWLYWNSSFFFLDRSGKTLLAAVWNIGLYCQELLSLYLKEKRETCSVTKFVKFMLLLFTLQLPSRIYQSNFHFLSCS